MMIWIKMMINLKHPWQDVQGCIISRLIITVIIGIIQRLADML